jgi:SsrA-binding protein
MVKNKDTKAKPGKFSPQVTNKKAFFNYEIVEKVEAGISLLGTEVKSLRSGLCELDGSYARITDGEVWLIGAKIAQYEKASITNHPPLRNRKLLLHRNQIKKLVSKLELSGFTLIPLRIYFNDRGIAKVELGIARGKRQFDKRSKITEREQKRDIDRSTKRFRAK